MKETIRTIIAKLEKQSKLEKSRKVDVSPERRMLAITPETARFFHALLKSIRARQVLELGTSIGYSTLWFADALLANHKNPKITTIEGSSLKVQMADANFRSAEVSKIIKIRHAQILDALSEMPKKPAFDFVLIDADKENIELYFDLVLPMVRTGGIIATDNVLLPKKYRRFMDKYRKHIQSHQNVVSGTIPIGYGEEITIKIR